MLNFDRFVEGNNAVLICTEVNRRYISGFPSDIGYLFITAEEKILLVDGRYFEAACHSASPGIKTVLLERLPKQINALLIASGSKNLFVETEITVAQLQRFESVFNCTVTPSSELCELLLQSRSVKSDEEISCIEKAQRIAETAFESVLNFIKPGVSEREIALRLDYEMRSRGSDGVSFDTIAVSGENTSLPHGVPSDRKVKSGDFITMDFGAVYSGYHSDMTRTVAVGHVTDYMTEIYDLVLRAQLKAIDMVKTGAICSIVDDAARRMITMAGYAGNFNHSTGHGVGLAIHEFPNLSPKTPTKLVDHQVVTVEPGIYLPGKFGVRIEDMVVVKDNFRQNLTKTPKALIILS